VKSQVKSTSKIEEERVAGLIKLSEERITRNEEDSRRRIDAERERIDLERKDSEERKKKLEELEEKVAQKEDRLEKKLEELETRSMSLSKEQETLQSKSREIDTLKHELSGKLEEISKLSQDDARELLMKQTEEKYEKDLLAIIEKKKNEIRIKEKEISREIIIKSIQQYANEVTAETTQTTIKLESDDVKGKLIGKEGRNIIAFERATGVSLVIDDTPDTVFISSFDLFRRYIAKKSLEALIEDKRIQPARIEELVEQNQKDAEKLLFEIGEQTVNEMGIVGLPEELISLIGKLRFRTSYGQNILTHSKEVAYIAEAIAKQIGADPALALKGGLLHDIGKAVDHDIEGTHPEIGGRIARKYGLNENLINIIEGHHDGVPQICIETKIAQIADAISAVRPGARRMSAELYIKRIQEMENLAMSFPGVSKAYALSAGREVRVFVDADTVSDLEAENLAREIATNIETNLSYPGEVKVNLIREKRVIEFAR
jgi:ribonuclease Y